MKSTIAILLLAASVAAGVATGATARTPVLRIVRSDPTVAVSGTHFRAREHVRVTLNAVGTTHTRIVRAGATGTFGANLGALPAAYDPCNDSYVVIARGSTGDHATVKSVPRECPPAP